MSPAKRDQAAVLQRRRNVLLHFRSSMDLVVRMRAGRGFTAITENVSPELVEQLKPIVDADLARQLDEIDAQLAGLGVKSARVAASLEIEPD